MRKPILFLAAMLLTSNIVFSQSSSSSSSSANGADKSFHFGLNFKTGYYWLSASSPNAANSGSIGYGFGVNLEFYFTQNYGFCTGLEITSFKANYTTTTSWTPAHSPLAIDSITAHSYTMKYLEIPLMLKFRTLPIGLMKYFGTVGLAPGVRIGDMDSYTVTGNAMNPTPYSEPNVSASNETSILRLAYVIGGGVEYNIAGTTSLMGMLSFDSDFINMNTTSNGVTNKTITLTIGVLF